MPGKPTFGRYAEIPVDEMTREQRDGYRFLVDEEVGLPAAAVEAIIAGLPASFADAREQVVYEVAMALAGGRLVSQGLYDRAVNLLGHESITDMIVLIGYYTCVSLTMNFYAVPAGSPGLVR